MPFVRKETELDHASAFLNIMGTHIPGVDQNACLTAIATDRELASTTNVKILARELAV